MSETEIKYRTITLTGRPPVKIVDADWASIATAKWFDGQYEAQANRSAMIRVREHKVDGRVIVSGVYSTNWRGEADVRAGILVDLDRETTTAQSGGDSAVVSAIHQVAEELGMPELAQTCIADLPAVSI